MTRYDPSSSRRTVLASAAAVRQDASSADDGAIVQYTHWNRANQQWQPVVRV